MVYVHGPQGYDLITPLTQTATWSFWGCGHLHIESCREQVLLVVAASDLAPDICALNSATMVVIGIIIKTIMVIVTDLYSPRGASP